jgi:hypothetical protein
LRRSLLAIVTFLNIAALCSRFRHHLVVAVATEAEASLSVTASPFTSHVLCLLSCTSRRQVKPPACPPASCARPPSGPGVPVSVVAKAKQSASTRMDARLARTAQRACTNVICPPSPWRITMVKVPPGTPAPTALRVSLSRVPAPALPQIPLGRPWRAQQVPAEVVVAVTCQPSRSESFYSFASYSITQHGFSFVHGLLHVCSLSASAD